MKKIVVLLIIFTFSSLSFAAPYYVSELFGSDETGDGSEGNPYATIGKAVSLAGPGDEVIVDFGTYNETITPLLPTPTGEQLVIKAKETGEAEITTGAAYDLPTFNLSSGSIYETNEIIRQVTSMTEDGVPLTSKPALDSLVAQSWYQDRATSVLYVWSSDSADPATHADTVFYKSLSFDMLEVSDLTIEGFVIKNGIQAKTTINDKSLPDLMIKNNEFVGENPYSTAITIDGGTDSVNTYESFIIKENIFNNGAMVRINNAGRNSLIAQNTFIGIKDIDIAGSDMMRVEATTGAGYQSDGLIIESNFWYYPDQRCLYLRNGKHKDITLRNNIIYGGFFTTFGIRHAVDVDIINNTFIFQGLNHPIRFRNSASGRMYNNIIAYTISRGYFLFFDNTGDDSLLFELDYNYYVNDTTSNNTRDDEMIRSRIPESLTNYAGGPNAVYGHPMRAWQDTIFTLSGDTVVVDSTRLTLWGDSVAVDSIPDMWESDAYPLFADTAAGTVEGLMLVAGSNAIDAGYNEVAPEFDFFGNTRADGKVDMGAHEFGAVNSVATVKGTKPESYSLSYNYPNPFNPTTTFQYHLPEAGHIQLYVYNVIGQKIATVFDGFRKMGTHTAAWNGKNNSGHHSPTGVYFLKLKAGDFNKSIKMVLIR